MFVETTQDKTSSTAEMLVEKQLNFLNLVIGKKLKDEGRYLAMRKSSLCLLGGQPTKRWDLKREVQSDYDEIEDDFQSI